MSGSNTSNFLAASVSKPCINSTFHLFPRLPAELRRTIWKYHRPKPSILCSNENEISVQARRAFAAIVQACSESRTCFVVPATRSGRHEGQNAEQHARYIFCRPFPTMKGGLYIDFEQDSLQVKESGKLRMRLRKFSSIRHLMLILIYWKEVSQWDEITKTHIQNLILLPTCDGFTTTQYFFDVAKIHPTIKTLHFKLPHIEYRANPPSRYVSLDWDGEVENVKDSRNQEIQTRWLDHWWLESQKSKELGPKFVIPDIRWLLELAKGGFSQIAGRQD